MSRSASAHGSSVEKRSRPEARPAAIRQVQGHGEQLQLEGVVDQTPIAHPGVAVPALEEREGALDRRPDCPDRAVPGAVSGIERPLPIVAGHDAVGDALFEQARPLPGAVVALVGVHCPLVALDQVEEGHFVRDVAGGQDRPAHQARALVDGKCIL